MILPHLPSLASITAVITLVGGLGAAISKWQKTRDFFIAGRSKAKSVLSRPKPSQESFIPVAGGALSEDLVPRSALLRKLQDALQESRHGGVLLWIQGETGMGKTELVKFFLREQVENLPPPFILSFATSRVERTQSAPYMKLLDALKKLHDQSPESPQVHLLKKYAPIWLADIVQIEKSGGERPEPETKRLQQMEEFLRHVTEDSHLVFFVDDIQWVDNATVRLLAHLLEGMRHDRALFIFTWQQNIPLFPALNELLDETARRGTLRKLDVDRLTRSELSAIIANHFPKVPFPAEFQELIESISGANALFVDNLLEASETRGYADAVKSGGADRTALEGLRKSLPSTLRDLIEQRFSTLNAEQLQLLEQASFQGIQFDSALLSTALQRNQRGIENELLQLDHVQLLVERIGPERTDDGSPNERYRFRHAIYVDHLRRELQAASRVEYARQMARSQERHYSKSLSLSASRLADLYRIAGMPTEEGSYLVLAAETSLQRADLSEAIHLARQGVILLNDLPESNEILRLKLRAELVAGLVTALQNTYSAPQVKRHYVVARQLAETLGDQKSRFRALAGEWLHELVVANLDRAYELAIDMRSYCLPATTEELRIDSVEALWAVGVTAYFQGKMVEARDALQRGIAAYRMEDHPRYAVSYTLDPGVSCHYLLGRALWILGMPDSALRETSKSIEIASQVNHTESEAFALASEAVVRHLRGEPAEVLQLTRKLRQLDRGDALRQFTAWPTILEGWANSVLGQTETGLGEVEQGLAAYRATGSILVLPSFQAICADCLLGANRPQEALELVDAGLRESSAHGQCYADAELLRLGGEALLLADASNGKPREAARHRFLAALELANKQEAQGFALRAAVSLARVADSHYERVQARTELSRLLEAGREGIELQDFQHASALLAKLSEHVDDVRG